MEFSKFCGFNWKMLISLTSSLHGISFHYVPFRLEYERSMRLFLRRFNLASEWKLDDHDIILIERV